MMMGRPDGQLVFVDLFYVRLFTMCHRSVIHEPAFNFQGCFGISICLFFNFMVSFLRLFNYKVELLRAKALLNTCF